LDTRFGETGSNGQSDSVVQPLNTSSDNTTSDSEIDGVKTSTSNDIARECGSTSNARSSQSKLSGHGNESLGSSGRTNESNTFYDKPTGSSQNTNLIGHP
jgi:hypothetical protein